MTLKNRIRVNGLLLTISIVVLLNSCYVPSKPDPADFNFDLFYLQTKSTPQSFTVNAGVNSTIVGAKGTIVNIPANSFETMGGIPVTGNVTFYLTEVYDNGEMILNQKPTSANDQLLVSGGVVNLSAYQGGQRLTLTSDINLLMPTSNTSAIPSINMQVFYWDDNVATSTPNDSTWVPQDSSMSPVDSAWTYDPSYNPGSVWYYSMSVSNLTWINCDYFSGVSPLYGVQADVPDGYTSINTRVYLILTDVNACLEMHDYGCDSYEFCTATNGAPAGYNYVIAAIHYDYDTGAYSSCITDVSTIAASGNVVTLNFTHSTPPQFEAAILAL